MTRAISEQTDARRLIESKRARSSSTLNCRAAFWRLMLPRVLPSFVTAATERIRTTTRTMVSSSIEAPLREFFGLTA